MLGDDLSWAEFEARYRTRLDGYGVDKIRGVFHAIARSYPGKPLVLMCYEDLTKAACHRRLFAEWWQEQTGEHVEEMAPALVNQTMLDV